MNGRVSGNGILHCKNVPVGDVRPERRPNNAHLLSQIVYLVVKQDDARLTGNLLRVFRKLLLKLREELAEKALLREWNDITRKYENIGPGNQFYVMIEFDMQVGSDLYLHSVVSLSYRDFSEDGQP